ncbi:OmpA family protein [Reichenbachiella sp.]
MNWTLNAQIKTKLAKLSNPEARGDHANSSFNYEEAASFYKKAIELDNSDQDLYLKLAECYRMESRFDEAIKYYKPVLEDPTFEVPNIYKLRYAQSLLAVNKVKEAKNWFYEHHKKDTLTLTENRIAGLEHYQEFFKSEGSIQVKKLEINSSERDYSPVFFKRGILFVSERPHQLLFKKGKPNSDENKIHFSNLFFSTRRAEGYFEEPEMLGATINTDFHEGPLCVYQNQQKLVFTRNNYLKRRMSSNGDGVKMLQLYFAELNKHGDWGNVTPFQHNNKNYSSAHPAMNEQGNLLIFASNMPGGFGGSDLYYCTLQSDSSWSKPVNLGKKINTEGNEYFPTLDGNSLFFSSNGHPGIGGLDIYQTTFINNKVGEIANLGVPINSYADDFGYIVDGTGNKGYFSSNRDEPLNDELYEFSKVPVSLSIDLVDSRSAQKLTNGTVTVALGGANNKTWDYRGNKVRLTSVLNANHKVFLESPQYFDLEKTIDTGTENPKQTREYIFKLKRKPDLVNDSIQLIVNGEQIFLAFDKNVYTPHYGDDVVITDGVHSISLGFPLTQKEHMKLPSTLIRNGYKIKKPIVVDNIYYATNIYDLRRQDKVVLKEYADVMVEFDELNIFINSHADSRGSKKYNLALSEKRAEAAMAYLKENGVTPERMNMLYFGEHVPENDCIDGVNCSEEDYQQNRKSEFGFYVRKTLE